MRDPAVTDRPAKPDRTRRRALFVVAAILLLGAIGLGSLQVSELFEQSGAGDNAQAESSGASLDDLSSNPVSDTEKAQIPAPGSTENKDSDPESVAPELDESELGGDSADEQAGLGISGAVLDDSGQLLPGIPVTARPAQPSGAGQVAAQAGPRVLRQQTDRLGSFTFDNLAEGEYELAVDESAQYHPTKLRVRAGVANAELILQRIRTVRVYGVITDDVGNPLEEVRVRALGSNRPVLSDISGGYEIQTGPSKAGQPPVLDFSKKDYRDSRQRVEGVLGSEATEVRLDVELEWESKGSKVTVSGLILGPAGEPVGGARVRLKSSDSQAVEKATSSGSGEYRFTDVEVGDAYTLGVDPQDEYAAYTSDVLSIGPGDFIYDVKLDSAGFSKLSGTVTDLGGTPLSDFTLWIRNVEMGGDPPMPVLTDGAGGFRLERIRAGAIKLESRSQPWLEATGIVLKPGESRHVEVPLDWGRDWLLGQVVNEQGDPVARANVVLQWSQQFLDITSESRRQVMSDQGGYFALSNLDALDYTLTVRANGYDSYRARYRLDQNDEELRVTLTR